MGIMRKTVLFSLLSGAVGLWPLWGHAQTSAEYKWWALRVNAEKAHAITNIDPAGKRYGRDITVAVVDTGISASHAEFGGSFGNRVLPGYDYFSSGNGRYDGDGHGTHVAGIAAAGLNGFGMVGIAPEAWLLPVKVLNDSGSGSSTSLDAGVKWAIDNHVRPVSGVPTQKTVFNMSLGGSTAFGLTTLQRIRNAGTIGIVAAGNEGRKDPSYPARYASDKSVAGWIIAVGAVDSQNRLASFSNKAGVTRDYYLVAPGVGIESTLPGGVYDSWSGTSMAAPVVAGAAALVWGAWPYLTGDKVVSSLLLSATDLGDPGVDSTFGRGLLNVEAAMKPIGDTCIPSTTNSCGETSPTKPGGSKPRSKAYAAPAAAGMAPVNSAAQVVGYDSLGRHFHYPAAVMLRAGGVNVLNNLDGWLAGSQPLRSVQGRGSARMTMQGDLHAGVSGVALTQAEGSNGYVMMFSGAGVLPFGVSHGDYRSQAFVGSDALKIPYLGLIDSPAGLAFGKRFAEGYGVRLGLVASTEQGAARADRPFQPMMQEVTRAAGLVELSARWSGIELTTTVGSLTEDGSFLGAVNSHTRTSGDTGFFSVSAVRELAPGLSLMASFSRGRSEGATADRGADYSATTEARSLGLLKRAFLVKDDQLALSLTLPSRVTRGQVLLGAAVDVNMETGEPIFGTVPVSLAPQGRERRFELSWSMPVRAGTLALTAMHRSQPNHDLDAPAQNLVGVRFMRAF